jgi:hypothetical protein
MLSIWLVCKYQPTTRNGPPRLTVMTDLRTHENMTSAIYFKMRLSCLSSTAAMSVCAGDKSRRSSRIPLMIRGRYRLETPLQHSRTASMGTDAYDKAIYDNVSKKSLVFLLLPSRPIVPADASQSGVCFFACRVQLSNQAPPPSMQAHMDTPILNRTTYPACMLRRDFPALCFARPISRPPSAASG